jgi:hypothetical protein
MLLSFLNIYLVMVKSYPVLLVLPNYQQSVGGLWMVLWVMMLEATSLMAEYSLLSPPPLNYSLMARM